MKKTGLCPSFLFGGPEVTCDSFLQKSFCSAVFLFEKMDTFMYNGK